MKQSKTASSRLDERLKQGSKTIFFWTLAWLICTALLAFGPKLIWNFNIPITLSVVALNIIAGIRMLWVNKQHLAQMDELQRKIHMNAMAVSLGLTMIFGSLYGLLEPAGLLDHTPNPGNILFVMGISYLVSVVLNNRKYS
ncbi:hypothetical protein [Planctobacterium marinum]|uniref:hypothetical protein n=1 Tax=Planctobacterium marinum TaxID=1631968 RepID=UPI001E40DF26|nr:hypothetical protein [Planctobacterium marinum]MCC2607416.1 hypothetical protein [Planctobacterium marinum]